MRMKIRFTLCQCELFCSIRKYSQTLLKNFNTLKREEEILISFCHYLVLQDFRKNENLNEFHPNQYFAIYKNHKT